MSGPFGSSQWMYASGGFYGFEISNSLRFNGSTSFLARTPSSTGNRRTFTYSCWFKIGDPSEFQVLLGAGDYDGGAGAFRLVIGGTGRILLEDFDQPGGSYNLRWNIPDTQMVLVDPASWYNAVLSIDTTPSTPVIKLFINGTDITSSFTNKLATPSQNDQLFISVSGEPIRVGYDQLGNKYHNGYLQECVYLDGTAVSDASDFGELKENIWIPKNYSGGSFGTNGFRLEMKQSGTGTASASTVGADTSGNNNHMTSTDIASTDHMSDSCTNNFCVMNPIGHSDGATPGTLSAGNLVVNTGDAKTITYGTFAIPTSGKYYFEVTAGTTNSTQLGLAVRRDGSTFRSFAYRANGDSVTNTTVSAVAPFASFTSGDVIGVAVDSDTPDVEFFKNGSSQGSINIDFSLDSGDLFPFVTDTNSSASCIVTFNFGATAFAQTVPSGFDKKLSTADLPSPAVGDPEEAENPTDYFSIKTYTGNGSTQSITGVGLQSDWTWIKNRSAADAHALTDSVRGVTKELQSNATSAESTNADGLTAFGADGFSLGDDDIYNTNTESYVSWNWKAGTAFSNDAGSNGATITSSGSTNQEAGFSIVSYSGNSTSGATVFHNLSASVAMIIVKDRSEARAWCVYHKELADDNKLNLNSTGAAALPGTLQFDTSANTTSVFGLGNNTATNNSSENYIAYVFSEKSGYSKFGSYVGNGDADGTFIFLNFRASWILIKRTDSADDWMIVDTARADVVDRNPVDNILESNTSDAEESGLPCNFNSNGFKIKTTDAAFNADGGNYIYMAFADQPLKFANSR